MGKEKKHFLCCGRFHSTQILIGRVKQNRPDGGRSKTFLGKYCQQTKTKHQSLTNLTFMWLTPGTDRAFRDICIWCTAVLRKVVFAKEEKLTRQCQKRLWVMGILPFHDWSSRCFSLKKETAQTRVFIISPSFLLDTVNLNQAAPNSYYP